MRSTAPVYDHLNGSDDVFTQMEEPKGTLCFLNNQIGRYTTKTDDYNSLSSFLKKTPESLKHEEQM